MKLIKKNIFRLICLFKFIFYKLTLSNNLFKINVNKWFLLNGDKNYLTKHNLNKNSIIFEVGGYTGVFSDEIIKLYNPYIYIFEPVDRFYNILIKKYENNKKIKVYNFGLSNKNEELNITISNDASSIFKKEGSKEKIILKDIIYFLKEEKILNNIKIDLISINIEGGEYKLLEKLLKNTNNFKLIQVQFHDFIKNASVKRSDILNILKNKGYKSTYSFPFVWECFKK